MAEELKGRLIKRIIRCENVESFRFLPERKVDFLPGQFLEVVFDRYARDNKELNKYLSLSSSPTRDYLEVTKKLSESQFSQKLRGLKTGDEILLRVPMGGCVFKDEYKKIGFLIGGIGITPVISILEYIVDRKLGTDVYLFYSSRTDEEIAFKKELDEWQAACKNIRVFYTVTDCQPKDKTCLFGFIDKRLLEEKACDITERVLFVYGPPRMVETMCNLSLDLKCKKENIRTERFIGY